MPEFLTMVTYTDYHLMRTLKGLQDDFDRCPTISGRVRLAHSIAEICDVAGVNKQRRDSHDLYSGY